MGRRDGGEKLRGMGWDWDGKETNNNAHFAERGAIRL